MLRLENPKNSFSKTICIELFHGKYGVLYLHIDPQNKIRLHFSDLKDTYIFSNFVKSSTCFKSSKGTLLDVLLTNKLSKDLSKSFQKTFLRETGLSDCHKLVVIIFRSTFIKLPPKVVKYRSYKNFDENKFCYNLDQILIKGDLYKAKNPYNKLTNI